MDKGVINTVCIDLLFKDGMRKNIAIRNTDLVEMNDEQRDRFLQHFLGLFDGSGSVYFKVSKNRYVKVFLDKLSSVEVYLEYNI